MSRSEVQVLQGPIFNKQNLEGLATKMGRAEVIGLYDRCNNNCIFCFKAHHRKDGVDMPLEKIKQQIDASQSKIFDLFGGEPTIHNNFFDILDYLEEKDKEFFISTNMRMFSDDEFLDRVLSYKNFKRIRSTLLGGNAETHDYYTQVPGSFDEAVLGFKKFRSKSNLPLNINHVILPRNYTQFDDMYKLLSGIGGVEFKYALITNATGLDVTPFYVKIRDITKYLYPVIQKMYINKDSFQFEKSPLCMIPQFADRFRLLNNKNSPRYTHTESCRACMFYGHQVCQGITKESYSILGEEAVAPIQPKNIDEEHMYESQIARIKRKAKYFYR